MMQVARQVWLDESGGTAIEYALIASFIFLAIISVIGQVGSSLTGVFVAVNNGFPS